MNRPRFVVLDAWRGVCAILVAIHNLNYGMWLPQTTFVAHASLFVDFFFVLSGFVISHAYGDKLTHARDVGAFMLRRLGRVWPLHVATLAVLVGVFLIKLLAVTMLHLPLDGPPAEAGVMRTIAANLLLVQALDAPSRLTWNAPSWSISTELWTYCLFAAVCLVSTNRRRSVLLMGSIAIGAAGALLLWSPNYLATNTDYAFLRCVYGFCFGHLVYRAWDRAPFRRRGGGMLELAALALVVGFVFITGNGICSMAAPLIFGFAVWVFAQEMGRLSKLLRTRPFVLLGMWSYSIYMVHWLVRSVLLRGSAILGRLVSAEANAVHIPLGGWWAMAALLSGYLIAVVVLAAMTYEMIEKPARSFFSRMADRFSLEAGRSG